MVDFGGWHMPVQYAGILAEHKAVREDVGLFDVSHMGEADFEGPGAFATVQRLVTNDVAKLVDGRAVYTCTCREDGGIVDDCIVYRFGPERYRIVINAANIDKDLAHFRANLGPDTTLVDRSDETALIAVQGPNARDLVARLCGAHLLDVPSFGFASGTLAGVEIVAARTGYTGEDGFELFVPADGAMAVWGALREAGAPPIGLGARDTLRLEARLCLYGNDIDESTNPIEAGLAWVVKPDKGDFLGKGPIVAMKERGAPRQLVGLVLEGRGIARAGWTVVDDTGAEIGHVTSGGPAPTVGGAIALAYVPTNLSAPGTTLTLTQGEKTVTAKIVKGPFYKRPK
jgi:aminomethyltransferase